MAAYLEGYVSGYGHNLSSNYLTEIEGISNHTFIVAAGVFE